MKLSDKMRDALRSFLRLEPAAKRSITVREELDFKANAFKNSIWYGGSSYELSQFYSQAANHNECFWGASSTPGLEIRKIHTGLPKIIVNTLADICLGDLNAIEIADKSQAELWEKIAEENGFERLLKKATKQALYIGDGAFKISVDTDMSDYPIIEWFPGNRVEFVLERGRLREIVYLTEYEHNGCHYVLRERYGYGFVDYELYKDSVPVDLAAIPETEGLQRAEFDKSVLLGAPLIIHQSEHWEGRGQSIFDGKSDNFDSLDEAYSQWVQAMRASRPKTYTPESLIPRNPANGGLLRPSAFDNQFIKIGDSMAEDAKNLITLQQPAFPAGDYLSTYVTALDLCLQGLISPSTLGIDNKKLDNAEAQREKEKATLYSRSAIIEALTPVIRSVVSLAVQADALLGGGSVCEVEVEISFGEYANPSFEAVVETLSNPNTPMSIEAKVEEMWGDTRDDEWKKLEIRRIKEQTGIVSLPEPALGNDLPADGVAVDEKGSDEEVAVDEDA